MMKLPFKYGSVVWVRIGQKWWPGTVTTLERCPLGYSMNFKKDPLAIVKFFNENEYIDITKKDHILSFNCNKKVDFIRKGLNAIKHDEDLLKKFKFDVEMAEKLTGGNTNIIEELKPTNKRRIDYSDLGFGTPKVKKLKDESRQRQGFSDIGEAIIYKRGANPAKINIIQHQVRILEQPKSEEAEGDASAACWFKCYICGYTCSRLNVIIWHNKAHLNKVANYDTGIKGLTQRKRKHHSPRSKSSKNKQPPKVDHSHTNGHVSSNLKHQGAQELLQDWDDEDNDTPAVATAAVVAAAEQIDSDLEKEPLSKETPSTNGHEPSQKPDGDIDSDDAYDDNYPPPTPRKERQPMPKQVDINSAFDALLAESPAVSESPNSQNSTYVNNDSDSDASDWEKYYEKDSDSLSINGKHDIPEDSETAEQNGEREIIPESNPTSEASSHSEPSNATDVDKTINGSANESSETVTHEESKAESPETPSSDTKDDLNESTMEDDTDLKDKDDSSSLPSELPEDTESHDHEESSESKPSTTESTTHSSASSSSNSAYMLVAVDAQGNNVPMPVLSEGGNHLVAVEASMEDGTTRTLYIDPAHLGPNVDLSNLMLHIDNSGQETVIIPTSSADGEIISSTLVEQQDLNGDSNTLEDKSDK